MDTGALLTESRDADPPVTGPPPSSNRCAVPAHPSPDHRPPSSRYAMLSFLLSFECGGCRPREDDRVEGDKAGRGEAQRVDLEVVDLGMAGQICRECECDAGEF